MLKRTLLIASVLVVLGIPPISMAGENAVELGAKQCEALGSADLASVQDAPTQVTEAKLVEASDDLPAYCRVKGYVAPNVGIEMHLPIAGWNRKFLEVGCGGYCGVISADECDNAVRKGYACIASDMGHQGEGGVWAYNNLQAQVDYGFRATHVAALAGKAITERFYSSAPARSYYTGCSTGGRQGLVEAQRFPWDFDGIVAGAPAINLSATLLNIMWASLAVEDKNGKPLLTQADVQLVHDAALAKCDMDDGLKDGVISNPRVCKFDPSSLLCKAGSSNQCLSNEKVEAVSKIYSGPMTPGGKQIYPNANGSLPGAELEFLSYEDGSPFSRDFFRFLAFMPDPGPKWERREFDFDHDYQRLGMVEALYGGTDPDLRRFKAAGGKLILYHGWADAGGGGISPRKTVDYYEAVERAMGGRDATREFLRFFTMPGMGHCGGGAGANDFDYLSSLESWVEKGQAPDILIGGHLDFDRFIKAYMSADSNAVREKIIADMNNFMRDPSNRTFTRPVYLYPAYAKYKGTGDPNKAENFVPANDK
jgi:hypothetical protein